MTRPLVVLTDPLLPDVTARYEDRLELEVASPGPHLDAALSRAEGLVTLLSVPVDEALLAKAPRLQVVGNYAVGLDNVDLEACRARGVAVVNTPDALTRSTAEQALLLLMAAARRLPESDRLARSGAWGGWRPDQLLGTEIRGLKVLIVGPGRIGQETARLLSALGAEIQTLARGAPDDEIDAKLAQAEAISLHLPLNDATRGWLSEERLARLPAGCVVVNTARGGVIDEEALIAELERGRLRAGLDVFADEPRVPVRLRSLEHVVLAAHTGSATTTARRGMVEKALGGVAAVLAGERPENRVV